jgi:acyl-CoA reductase-like NAD-dependent aldehyde dehydrogenase
MSVYKLLINGEFVDGAGGTADVINPATEKAVAACPIADVAQVNAAVAAAKAAFPAWSRRTVAERGQLVDQLANALMARQDEFAALLTAEQGKPLDQAAFEVIGSVFTLKGFVDMKLEPKILRETPENRVIEYRAPLGVVAAITPWNFPLILLMNKLGPCLLAGNTMVSKPAPTTPLTTLLFATIANEILPPGVFNVVCDRNDLGGVLTAHPDVAKVAFTGSTATGRKVMKSASDTVKRVTLELGGNDAAIVLDDVDPIEIAGKLFFGATLNAGQICVAVKRAYIPASMYDGVCGELARLADAAVVDDGDKPGTQIGPVQNKAQYEKLKEFLADAKANGNIIAGGTTLNRPGYFIRPTIVRDIPETSRIVAEEQFGPILPVLSYTDVNEVVATVNQSEFGLAGTVWGKDVNRAMEIAAQVDSGTIWVNQHLAIEAAIPFRGAKQSGLGAELGEAGLLEYTQARVVNAALG